MEDPLDKAIQDIDDASHSLVYFEGRILNGDGKLRDPSQAKAILRDAIAKLAGALDAIREQGA